MVKSWEEGISMVMTRFPNTVATLMKLHYGDIASDSFSDEERVKLYLTNKIASPQGQDSLNKRSFYALCDYIIKTFAPDEVIMEWKMKGWIPSLRDPCIYRPSYSFSCSSSILNSIWQECGWHSIKPLHLL